MHIALYHDAVIPPARYGGTERIVYWLAQALLKFGHQITLVARAGSHVPGAELIVIPEATRGKATDAWEKLLPSDVDLIHLQATPHTPPAKPFLVTIHGNGQPGERFLPNTVFLSKKHAQNHGASVFVHNGINPDEYPCDASRDSSLVFLAKASWKVKNLAAAIELARAADLPLQVMGSRNWPFQLRRKLPAWRGIRYLGMVDDSTKREVLRKSHALLFPVRWHEPFGIAISEALASGCSVFGTPYGSLPELVTPDVGLLSNDANTLFQAIVHSHKTQAFKPETCRARVLQGLTHLDMAKNYLRLYEQILAGKSLNSPSDLLQTQSKDPAQKLLPYRFLRD